MPFLLYFKTRWLNKKKFYGKKGKRWRKREKIFRGRNRSLRLSWLEWRKCIKYRFVLFVSKHSKPTKMLSKWRCHIWPCLTFCYQYKEMLRVIVSDQFPSKHWKLNNHSNRWIGNRWSSESKLEVIGARNSSPLILKQRSTTVTIKTAVRNN